MPEAGLLATAACDLCLAAAIMDKFMMAANGDYGSYGLVGRPPILGQSN